MRSRDGSIGSSLGIFEHVSTPNYARFFQKIRNLLSSRAHQWTGRYERMDTALEKASLRPARGERNVLIVVPGRERARRKARGRHRASTRNAARTTEGGNPGPPRESVARKNRAIATERAELAGRLRSKGGSFENGTAFPAVAPSWRLAGTPPFDRARPINESTRSWFQAETMSSVQTPLQIKARARNPMPDPVLEESGELLTHA